MSHGTFFSYFRYRITEFEAAERLSRDVQAQLVYRNSQAKLSAEYAKLSATIRLRLKQLSSELEQLDQKLEQNSVTGKMYAYTQHLPNFLPTHSLHLLFQSNTGRWVNQNDGNFNWKLYNPNWLDWRNNFETLMVRPVVLNCFKVAPACGRMTIVTFQCFAQIHQLAHKRFKVCDKNRSVFLTIKMRASNRCPRRFHVKKS